MADFEKVLGFEDARRMVEQHAREIAPESSEQIELLKARGRVLAEDILADRDTPPFPRAARDGYALRAADVAKIPATLAVVGEVRAGEDPNQKRISVAAGQAVEIMTGAAVPEGADAVVMVEYTSTEGEKVIVERSLTAGENVVPAGSEARKGDLAIKAGNVLNPAIVALAASFGKSRIKTYSRPRVAILSTGDEIVDIAVTPGAVQIRNSNSYSLAAQVEEAGGDPLLLPIAPDEKQQLQGLIQKGLESDLLLLTGGVSMGKYDLVEVVLRELGAEFFFTGAKIQPGKPIVFGSVRADAKQKYFFGLPGNPVSTLVTFELFARPMIEALTGRAPQSIRYLKARLKSEVRTKPGLTRFLPALLTGSFDGCEVELVRWQGSGDMVGTSQADCFLVIPPASDKLSAGDWVSILKPRWCA